MKYTTAEIEKHIAFVSGYLDAVGRHFTTESVLFSLWAEKGSKRINELTEIDIVGEKKIPEFVHELEQQVGEFLNTDTRERLVFYLLEYLIWFKEFTESFECYKLKVVFEPDERKYLAYKFVVNGSQEVYVFMTQLYKKNA